MVWDKVTAQEYDAWFDTPHGCYALEQEKKLLSHLISAWPRRGQRLLEIGCGTGRFLEMFWETGFDVSGLDAHAGMLQGACDRLGDRTELHLGAAEGLPFDDNQFDFTALITVLEFAESPGQVLAEAARVSRKGLLVGFLNKYSLYYLTHGLQLPRRPATTLRQARWFSPLGMRFLLSMHTDKKSTILRSVLPGPQCTWRPGFPWRFANDLFLPAWPGAFAAARVDFFPKKPLTPLLAFKAEPGMG